MMTNCGVDIVEISRIDSAIKKNSNFLKRVFSAAEIEYYNKKSNGVESLAGFFAAKEAFAKYLGTGISGFNFSDVSVEHSPEGAPFIVFKGEKQDVSLSISHEKTVAVAVVYGEQYQKELPLKDDMKKLLPKRPENANKGDFGKILVVAGSKGMTGAAALSAYSALRSGAGLVTLATAETERPITAGFYPEIMTAGLPSKDGIICTDALKDIFRLSEDKDVMVFGPGIGKGRDIGLILAEILKNYTGVLVIDADGLNALSKNMDILMEKTCDVILTPHPGEMSRLCKMTTKEVQQNRMEVAEKIAAKYDVCVVLKGNKTVVSAKDRTSFVNPTGNSGMATAGTGDVLAGTIAAFAAQGLKPFEAAKLGVFIHGAAGDVAKERKGTFGMIASDVAKSIPEAILKVEK
ncbi:MAG: NAD(P)H-hydrate dehydratase [Clostridia bacterium]|nr:NAD(P)H-hydrate dehydratase [Clostridia bacterium]